MWLWVTMVLTQEQTLDELLHSFPHWIDSVFFPDSQEKNLIGPVWVSYALNTTHSAESRDGNTW